MTSEADWYEPDGVPAHPRLLAPALAILAQFDSECAVLDHADVARLTGCSPLIAQRCLVTLAELGYLTEAPNDAYWLTGGESDSVHDGRDEDGSLDTAA
jgi:hypothetical protein